MLKKYGNLVRKAAYKTFPALNSYSYKNVEAPDC